MNKYYRVRTQEQWDWLMNKLGVKNISFKNWSSELTRNYDFVIKYGAEGIAEFVSENGLHNEARVIEVSQMMEDEKMEDYVTIDSEDFEKITNQYGKAICGGSMAEIRIPKSLLYPKVEFTKAEKAEFDSIDNDETLYNALDIIEREDYPHLYKRIYEHAIMSIPKFELEFARAWADPSLIEVLPEKKWHVRAPKVMDTIYIKNDDGSLKTWKKTNAKISDTFPIEEWYKTQFTAEELKHYGLDNDLFEKVEVSE